jgi:glycosyltransferase involved in cell wall biosynthesis
MESILLNVPVICSNVTSLPETIRNNKYVFDPDDLDDIAEKVELLYVSAQFREDCIRDCAAVKEKLKKNQAHAKFISLYTQLCK